MAWLAPPRRREEPEARGPRLRGNRRELRTRGRSPELGRDVVKDVLPAAARRRNRGNRHERDERHEQRVFEQVLAFFVQHERLDEIHDILLGRWHRVSAVRCAAWPRYVG